MIVQDCPELFFVFVLEKECVWRGKVNREADLLSLGFGHWISFIVYKGAVFESCQLIFHLLLFQV